MLLEKQGNRNCTMKVKWEITLNDFYLKKEKEKSIIVLVHRFKDQAL